MIPTELKVLHDTNNTKIICHYPPGAPAGGAIHKLETGSAFLDVCLAHIYFSKLVCKTERGSLEKKMMRTVNPSKLSNIYAAK